MDNRDSRIEYESVVNQDSIRNLKLKRVNECQEKIYCNIKYFYTIKVCVTKTYIFQYTSKKNKRRKKLAILE